MQQTVEQEFTVDVNEGLKRILWYQARRLGDRFLPLRSEWHRRTLLQRFGDVGELPPQETPF